jgi:PmbA protein
MTNKERLELGHWVAGKCKQAGADEAAVDISFDRGVEVTHQDRKLDKLSETTTNSLNLKIFQGGRYSSHSTSDMRRDSLGGFIEEAVAMTKYLAPDPDRTITDSRYYAGMVEMDLKLYDPAYHEVAAEDRVKMARDCEEAALASDDRVITCSGNYYDSHYASAKVHSNGFEGSSEGTYFQAYASVTMRGENDVRIDDYFLGAGLFRRDLPTAEEIGAKAVARALRKNGQKKIASGVYPMLVENRAVSRLLGATMSSMSGANLYRKNSFLIDKLDQKIASELLTITDEPHLVSAPGSRLYDDDGIPTRRRSLIENGVLKSYMIDYFWSRKLKVEPTSGTSNLIYALGERSLEDIVKSLDKAILVTSFVGGNNNDTTGEFSYGVIGEYIENGKVVQAINEMNITGDFNVLWNNLTELGNDPYMVSSNRRPSMLFKDVQFAGL